jgi:sister-chromatid-cohesion protein PDS5
MDVDEEWIDDNAVPHAYTAKIQSLKVCRHRCLALATADAALDVFTPVFKMLVTILENGGSLNTDSDEEYVANLLSVIR